MEPRSTPCKYSNTRSKNILLHMVLHALCFINSTQATELNARVISFQGARLLAPVGSPLTYTCIVEGRAVWTFGEFEVNTYIAMGNITNVFSLEGINITDCTDSNGYHVSKLHLSSYRMAEINSTNISCGASKGPGFAAVDEEEIPVKVFDVPTIPGPLMVTERSHLAATLQWTPSFLPYDMVPQYKIYINGELEGVVEQPLYVFRRNQSSCEVQEITVGAFNEVGTTNLSSPLDLTLPSVPDVSLIPGSVSTELVKTDSGSTLTIAFQPAITCPSYPVSGYRVKALANSTEVVETEVLAPTGPTVSATLTELLENTLYTFTISASNEVGSAETGSMMFYTADVLSLTAMEMNGGSVLLLCEFIEGSNALGCQVDFETLTRAGNFSLVLYRSGPESSVEQVITIPANLSCYHRITVYDVEADNSTSGLGMEGDLRANASHPCTAPMSNPVPGVPLAVIVAIPVAVVALILLLLIIVVVCCLLRNSSHKKGRQVNCSNGLSRDDQYSSHPGVSSDMSPSKEPLYDEVANYKSSTVPEH